MQSPPRSADEAGRLAALRRLDLLDTPAEPALDDLTALAAHICEAPISLVSLIDEHRQWFKSRVGLEIAETPRDVSFCAHAIAGTGVLTVPDAAADSRFAGNPLVTGDPRIRFYAGAPLVTADGHALGTLCVIDRVPRLLTPAQQSALSALSRQVMVQLELRHYLGELRDHQHQLRQLIDGLGPATFVGLMTTDGVLLEANRAALSAAGLRREDVLGQPFDHTYWWAYSAQAQAQLREAIARAAGGEASRYDVQIRVAPDTFLWIDFSLAPMRDGAGQVKYLVPSATVIDERKRAETVLRDSEARYRTLFEYAPDGIVIADTEGRITAANPSLCQMLGYAREELIGVHASAVVDAGEVTHIGPALRSITSGADYHRTWRFRRKDGSIVVADVMATLMPDGSPMGMIRDVTTRNRIEARFRRLVESNAQGVLFWNRRGAITDANDAFLRLVDYTREDLQAGRLNWAALTPPEYADLDRRGLEQIAAVGVCSPFEKEYIRKDGSRVPVLVGAASFEDDPREGVCFVLDLTERKKLEQQFLRAQRMESLGTLAGGIAHDLNNVLTPILLAVEMLKDQVADPGGLDSLMTLQTSAERGAALVRQVLSFARGVEGRKVAVDLAAIGRELTAVLRDTFPKSIDVRFMPVPGLWTVIGDPTQLHQVLMNLCLNSRDAMPDGGTLTLRMDNVVLDDTYSGMNLDSQPGAYVVIRVADTGSGIQQDVLDRIFEPFFTTKALGKGTGLGLSTTLAIVKSHGGFIHVYSEEGKGTTFKTYLPATSTADAVDRVAADQTGLPRGHGELILVVDDEDAIRKVAQRTLERYGYRVLLASHGAEAVALYAQQGEAIAAVLTDMAMPIMDGPALIVALKAINPAVVIVGSSGLASNEAMSRAVGAGVHLFVPKPYTAETILRTLRQALRGDSPPRPR